MNYAISDIHGDYDRFSEMLSVIDFKQNDKLFLLGDVVDRGKHGIKILEYVINSTNIQLVRGNHEDVMLSYLCMGNKNCLNDWLSIGGGETFDELYALSEAKQERIKSFLQSTRFVATSGKCIMTHAGIKLDLKYTSLQELMEQQISQDLLWMDESVLFEKAPDGYILVFGHLPTNKLREKRCEKRPALQEIWHNASYEKYCIDCGCGFDNGRLACLCLDDFSEFYV